MAAGPAPVPGVQAADQQPWISDAELSARLTEAKKTPEREWLSE